MHARSLALLAALGFVAVGSCAPPSVESDGGCSADVRLDGVIFRAVNGLHTPYRGESLGLGAWLDCEGMPVPTMGQARVFSIRGQDASRLVIVAENNHDAVYMKHTIPWRKRPQLIKDAEHYPACSGPARFTGTWDYVEPEDMPAMEDYGSVRVPYTGNFATREGTGVGLDRWAEVSLQAEFTRDTNPVPGAEFLERATRENLPVTVTAICRGKSFHVETIRFAR